MHLLNNVTPYKSSVDAISKFPETATALGVKLSIKGKLIVTTPCGIDDVLQCKVKPTAYFMATKERIDRKSTRLNSSHVAISYAVFCLKKKKNKERFKAVVIFG